MSCSEHPNAKLYYDSHQNHYRCSGCVKKSVRLSREKKKFPLGEVTEEILDSLGKDTPSKPSSFSEYGLTYGDHFGWSEHLSGLRTTPIPFSKGR